MEQMPGSATPVSDLDVLLDFIKESRGFDFTGYKRSGIERRVAKRMNEVGIAAGSYDDYTDYLELHGEEFVELFNALLINVTGFFRDPQTWEHLATDVIPALLANRPPDSQLRVWCAGCASGEEPYTVAMVLARVLGDAAFHDRVKIYATDVDEEALDQARHAAYLPRQIEDVPPEALERFFTRTDQRFVFRKDLRRSVIFGKNDLVQDAPISRIDLLVCRNTLMYFTAETQSQILRRFRFALQDDGVLLLGKSEMLITHGDLFTPLNLKWRIYTNVDRPVPRERLRLVAADGHNGASPTIVESLRAAAFDGSAAGTIVLDAAGVMVMANHTARRMFGLGMSDFGRPIQDLEMSYHPVELRSHLKALADGGRAVELGPVRARQHDQEFVLDVRLTPLTTDGVMLGTSITYHDVTDGDRLRTQLSESRTQLEQAYEELQSTVEELETTNEELQSTNEELETTNEELHSTNEELETMNEELQSSNEELETINDELRHRTQEMNDLNAFLETILTTIGIAVAVLDSGLRVQIWNAHARELWGITTDEAQDQQFLTLDIGLPVEQLAAQIRASLTGASPREELILEATNRRGKVFQCRVTSLPLGSSNNGGTSGVILMMEQVES
ncbi:MAG: CheR family methyltransferase [Solirubrobacteraceae bacterium]